MAVQQDRVVVLPELGRGSQLHQLTRELGRANVKHDQRVRAVVPNVKLEPVPYMPAPEVRFCNSVVLKPFYVEGVGDDSELPGKVLLTGAGHFIGGKLGYYTVEMEFYANGVVNATIRRALPQPGVFTRQQLAFLGVAL